MSSVTRGGGGSHRPPRTIKSRRDQVADSSTRSNTYERTGGEILRRISSTMRPGKAQHIQGIEAETAGDGGHLPPSLPQYPEYVALFPAAWWGGAGCHLTACAFRKCLIWLNYLQTRSHQENIVRGGLCLPPPPPVTLDIALGAEYSEFILFRERSVLS